MLCKRLLANLSIYLYIVHVLILGLSTVECPHLLRKDLDGLASLTIDADGAASDFAAFGLDDLLDGPGFVCGVGEPAEIVGDEMPVLAAGTLYDDDALGVGAFGEFVRAAMSALVDGACEGDGEALFDLSDRCAFTIDGDG